MTVDDLLTPSLGDSPRTPIFSVNALIAAAFFGGGVAVPLLALENARRLGRLRRDVLVLLPALLAAAAAVLVGFALAASDPEGGSSEVRLLNRGIGFAWVGLCYWLHRRPYRSLRMLGIDPASPWVAVIATVLVSFAVARWLHRLAAAGVLEGIV